LGQGGRNVGTKGGDKRGILPRVSRVWGRACKKGGVRGGMKKAHKVNTN